MKAQTQVTDFADKHRVKWKLDPDDQTTIVQGRDGSIYEWDGNTLAVMYLSDNGTAAKWNNARRACMAAGMTLLQDGDSEGSLSFDPDNREQAKLAIKIAHIKTERTLSPEALEKARKRMEHARGLKQTQSTGQKNAPLSAPKPLDDHLLISGTENVCKVAQSIIGEFLLPAESAKHGGTQ